MTQDTNEGAIRLLVENWAAAVRAQDMNGAIAQHADDIVMFDVPLPIQVNGIEDYKRTWDLFFANSQGGPDSFDLTELHITASETVAYCHAIIRIFESSARLSIGLRKEKSGWLITHEHHSYPLE